MTEQTQNKIIPQNLPNWAKYIVRGVLGLIALFLIFVFALSWYVKSHKTELLGKFTEKISKKINGKSVIEDIDFSIWKSFPNASIQLKNLSLSDSLVAQHHHPLLQLHDVFVRINLLSLFSKNPELGKITLSNGSFYLFTDAKGYSNDYLLSPKTDSTKNSSGGAKDKELAIDDLGIENVQFIVDNQRGNEKLDFLIKNVDAKIREEKNIFHILAETDVLVNQLGFDLKEGGFLRNKPVIANFDIDFDETSKTLHAKKKTIKIDDIPLDFEATFMLDKNPTFNLTANFLQLTLAKATTFLPKTIAESFDSLEIVEPLKVSSLIKGALNGGDPFVQVYYELKNSTINSTWGNLTNANFVGEYNNEASKGKGFNDENSIIFFKELNGKYENIPFTADSVMILNLSVPELKMRIHSSLPASELNGIVGHTFNFAKGNAKFDVRYHGPIFPTNTLQSYALNGIAKIENAAFDNLPNNIKVKDFDATMNFAGEDLYFSTINLSTKNSTLKMNGVLKHLLNPYFKTSTDLVLNWDIKSNSVDLNDFIGFATDRKKVQSKRNEDRAKRKLIEKFDKMMEASSMNLRMELGKIMYQRFVAKNIKADVDLLSKKIIFNKVALEHADGSLTLNGELHKNKMNELFSMNANIKKVNVSKLFYAFNNFGQNTINEQNLRGDFSAKIAFTGAMTDALHLIRNASKGTLDFSLENGALLNFEPIQKIQKFAFKRRDFSNVAFKTLSNRFTLANGKITIPPMTIASSVIEMDVNGVYGIENGTDIDIAVPLRNPEVDEIRLAKGLEKRKGKGLVIYLKSKDGDDGKVHLNWDSEHQFKSLLRF